MIIINENLLTEKVILEDKEINESLLNKENFYLLFYTVLLGVLGNILFFDKPLGISYFIFVLSFYTIFILSLKKMLKFEMSFGWVLSIPIAFLSTTFSIFSNSLFSLLNFLAIPILVIIQTTLLSGRNRNKWYEVRFGGDILYSLFVRVFGNLGKPFKLLSQTIATKINVEKHKNLYKVLIGLCFSLPLVLVVILLLSSADKVFESFINRIPNLFSNLNFGEFIVRVIFIVIVTIGSFSYIWSLHRNTNFQWFRTLLYTMVVYL